MIARLASGLKKLPAEVRTMTLPQVYELYDYWKDVPPEGEILAMLARCYTSWEPASAADALTPEAHRASLERRWASGHFLSPKQFFEATGGILNADGTGGGPGDMGGIGPFPGLH